MNSLILRIKKIMLSSKGISSLLLMSSALLTSGYTLAEPAQEPLFLTTAATPVVIFSMSRDHELFKKAYNDYTNMDGGVMTMRDTTYNNEFSYYGYFDSDWCYSYADEKFSPSNEADDHQCNGEEWSGNFLNWSTMTRIDILRQVLYGGKRVVDTEDSTVLERSYLPKDNHAFAKVYDPSTKDNTSGEVNLYTPYDEESITLCNVSSGNGGTPQIRVAKGNWYNWANTEVQQCQWITEATNPDHSSHAEKSQLATFTARVDVCVTDKDDQAERCRAYDNDIKKPTGVLQEYEDTINFGLVTGTWGKNRSGGILRKKAGPLVGNSFSTTDNVNEYDRSTGIFNSNVTGIIGNINRFEIVGYKFTSNSYSGNHTDWGNPIGEIYAETLRYLSGRRPSTTQFSGDGPTLSFFGDGSGPSGISKVDKWDDPLVNAEECTKCSVILISSGPNSWDSTGALGTDTDKITDGIVGSIVSGITLAKLNSDYTNKIGTLEFDAITKYFNGGADRSTQCSSVTLSGLSAVKGLCPEQPMDQGSYVTAGLAYLAKTNSIRSDQSKTMDTYAIELSQGLPSLDIPVGDSSMSIVPICTSVNHGQTCSLVSVRVEEIQLVDNKPVRGSYLFYWEDQSQGSDHDMDAVQRIEFCVGAYCADFGTGTGTDPDSTHRGNDKTYKKHASKLTHSSVGTNELRVINTIPYWATGAQMGLTYIISGTSSDGLQDSQWVKRGGDDLHNMVDDSGNAINSSNATRPTKWYNTIPPDGSDYLPRDDGTSRIYLNAKTFTPGSSTTNRLKTPLYYAAKYGNFDSLGTSGAPIGWDKKNNSTGAETPDGIPDAYFSVNNPSLLGPRLKEMLGQAAKTDASATAVATNSTRLTEGSKVYQAKFNSESWSGQLAILEVDSDNKLTETNIKTEADDATTFAQPAARNIYTSRKLSSGANQRQPFLWANMTESQRLLLRDGGSEELGQARVNWLRGDQTGEGALLRTREFLLGDIVNSSPVISGRKNARYQRFAGEAGLDYQTYQAPRLLFVGANDGKVHAFNPDTLNEVYAYVPNAIYPKLARVTSPNYGTGGSLHQYLVDGPLFVGDVYLNDEWRTVLVGTFGAGARGLYALDVTDAVPEVLFEYTEADYPQLGYMLGQPQIAPLPDGSWAVVAGNGYHYSGSPTSQLVVINLTTDTVSFIDTGAGRGLSEPALLPNMAGLVEYAYAGDLEGNLWKFDLKGTGSTAFDSKPLFNARDASGNPQPISAMPTLGLNKPKNNSVMVYFGTGKYFDVGDNVPTQFPVQSFYAIADTGVPVTYTSDTRSTVLHQKTISQVGKKRTVAGERTSASGVVASAVNWTDIYGWHVDFTPDHGERVITKPQLVFDRLIFTTLIPTGDPCKAGGVSWLMELVGVGNKSIAHQILDENVANTRRDEAVVSEMGLGLGSNDSLLIPLCDVSGTCDALIGELESGARGRMSWKQFD